MKKFNEGTKVWITNEIEFPFNITEGIIKQYAPQIVDGIKLKYYYVYCAEDDKTDLYVEEQLFTDKEKAIELQKELIQTYEQ